MVLREKRIRSGYHDCKEFAEILEVRYQYIVRKAKKYRLVSRCQPHPRPSPEGEGDNLCELVSGCSNITCDIIISKIHQALQNITSQDY